MKLKYILILATVISLYLIFSNQHYESLNDPLTKFVNKYFNRPVDYTCVNNADCTIGKIACSTCCGTEAINKNWKPICIFEPEVKCEACGTAGVAMCINNRCELIGLETIEVYGTILTKELSTEAILLRVNQTSKNCLSDNEGFEIKVTRQSFEKAKLKENESYPLHFSRLAIDTIWTVEPAEWYLKTCSYKHEEDLSYLFIHEIIPSCCEKNDGGLTCSCANSCWEKNAIKENETIRTKLRLENHAQHTLFFNISSTIHDYAVLKPNMGHWEKPSFEVRLANSKVDYCDSLYLDKVDSIVPNSTKILNFEVKCDGTQSGLNLSWKEFVQYLTISFTDELGLNHTSAKNYYLPTFKIC